jgi:hypothetical protein
LKICFRQDWSVVLLIKLLGREVRQPHHSGIWRLRFQHFRWTEAGWMGAIAPVLRYQWRIH